MSSTSDSAENISKKADGTSQADTVRAQKQTLRKEVRARVKALPREELLNQSQKVWDKLVQLPIYKKSKSVGLFLSMPKNEIATEGICRQCIKDGKHVYVPKVGIDFEHADMEMLKVIRATGDGNDPNKDDELFYQTWPQNKWGIPEPPTDMPIEIAEPGDIDLLVMPGLAFDHSGNRLGQGKGYYDRFIARMSVKPLPLVAVCLDCQLIDSPIPIQEYDRTMHMVLSPAQTVTVSMLEENVDGEKEGEEANKRPIKETTDSENVPNKEQKVGS